MAEEKLYTPEVISDAPFPNREAVSYSESSSESGGTYSNTTINEKTPPKKRVAVELLSTALNTRSKKILQEFQLEQSGGIKVGDFKEGTTGEMAITPNGLTAKDTAGLTTFAIDGLSGDAYFKGTIQAGSLVSGTLYLGSEAGSVYIDGASQQIIVNDGVNDRIIIGYQENGF